MGIHHEVGSLPRDFGTVAISSDVPFGKISFLRKKESVLSVIKFVKMAKGYMLFSSFTGKIANETL